MGIISRFAEIVKSNVNELLDKAEDPAKMIDQTLRDLKENLAECKTETAAVIAEETNAKRRVDELTVQIDGYMSSIKKAIAAGNDGDATKMLTRKQELEAQLATAESLYATAKSNADKMRKMYNKLVEDITVLEGRRENIKAQVAMASAQERVNETTAKMNATDAMGTFARMEKKAQDMLDRANAEADLSGTGLGNDEVENLQAKYANGTPASVADELAALKAEMGK